MTHCSRHVVGDMQSCAKTGSGHDLMSCVRITDWCCLWMYVLLPTAALQAKPFALQLVPTALTMASSGKRNMDQIGANLYKKVCNDASQSATWLHTTNFLVCSRNNFFFRVSDGVVSRGLDLSTARSEAAVHHLKLYFAVITGWSNPSKYDVKSIFHQTFAF